MIPTPRRKAIVEQHLYSVWDDRDPDSMDELCTDDFVMHDPMGDRDLDRAKGMLREVIDGTPDVEFTIEDLIASGDRVVVRYTLEGTNEAPSFLTDQPTGLHWRSPGITVYRFEGEEIAEQWNAFDYLGTMRQLGLIPSEADADTTGDAGAEA
ncbi:ester cyclase [Haloferax sp. DFSO60]|uniref:ester cyclase n=1 Tax=Haloferax sp. DFSO60 TaxID=3388652 RepID=UPI003978E342